MGVELTSPCTWVKHLPILLRNKANSQKQPSVYGDRRPKSEEDIENTDSKGIASGQKGPWDQRRVQGGCSPPLLGLPQDFWERAGLMAPSPARQGLSNTGETWLLEISGRGIRTKWKTQGEHRCWLRTVESWATCDPDPDSPRPSWRGGLCERTGPSL